jgi:hypothetical protein
MVDLTDTSMAASGTTKKVTVNQILGAGGTATLASATITGDLTVDTSTLKVDSANDRVGVGTATPGGSLEVFKNTNGQNRLILSNPNTGTGAYDAIDFTAGTANNQILSMGSGYSGSFPYLTGALLLRSAQANGIVLNTAGSAAAIQFGINDTLAMTLNANGLAIGTTTNYGKLSVAGSIASFASATIGAVSANSGYVVYSAYAGAGAYISFQPTNSSGTQFEAARIDSNGNLILSSSTVPATLASDYQLTLNATSNTNLRFSYRGSDGVTRVANITLA